MNIITFVKGKNLLYSTLHNRNYDALNKKSSNLTIQNRIEQCIRIQREIK